MKILIVDDTVTNVKQLEAVSRKLGHQTVVAMDGVEAVEQYRREAPDLIFMDIMMPRLDGVEAARAIRTIPSDRWVPIVFFSALDSIDDILRGLEAGGDDYLVKPANLQVIRAKINGYDRALAMQEQSRRYGHELALWREDAEEQNRLGQHIIGRLLDSPGLRDPMVQWMNTPAQSFSGDLVCATRGPGDVLYAMLADAAGHGLSAALTALPLSQVFHGMAHKGFPIHTLAEELNSKLKAFLPIDRFVAAVLVAVDTRNQTIEIWNGGAPEALMIGDDGAISMRWPSRHPPLGILPPALFSGATETVNYLQSGELVLYSDGIIEAENAAGDRINMHGLETMLCKAGPGKRLAEIRDGVEAHLSGREEHDDLSAIVLKVPIERRQSPRLPEAAATVEPARESIPEWRFDLSLSAGQLRVMDVVPALLGFMDQIKGMKAHQGQLFLILSELFNNALDHGLLRLDSRLKQEEGGFEYYLEERERRLRALDSGFIEVGFHLREHDGHPVLDIHLRDSGPGFDYAAYLSDRDEDVGKERPHGRGISLVHHLAEHMTYDDGGRSVRVSYVL